MPFDKDLLRGSLDLMVLSVLTDGPMYGHRIQKRIREASGKAVLLPGGTLYPLLHRMEVAGWIKAREVPDGEGNRRWYSLTRAGRRRLLRHGQQWQQYADCVLGLLKPAIENVQRTGVSEPPPA